MNRPLGVSIIAVLSIFVGVLAILFAIMAFALHAAPGPPCPEGALCTYPLLYSSLFPIAVINVAIGITAFFIAYGLLRGKKWSWWLVLIFSALGILLGIGDLASSFVNVFIFLLIWMLSIIFTVLQPLFFIVDSYSDLFSIVSGIILIIMSGVIAYYMMQKNAKAYFKV